MGPFAPVCRYPKVTCAVMPGHVLSLSRLVLPPFFPDGAKKGQCPGVLLARWQKHAQASLLLALDHDPIWSSNGYICSRGETTRISVVQAIVQEC